MVKRLRDTVCRLIEHKVDYVLVGGYASLIHGSSLMTEDVDVALDMRPENLRRLYAALKDLHLRHRVGMNKRAFEEKDADDSNWKNLYLMTDWGQLDCLSDVKGVGDFEAVAAASEVADLGEFQIRILKLDALIEAKRAIGRPKDLHAVHELEAIRELRKRKQQHEK